MKLYLLYITVLLLATLCPTTTRAQADTCAHDTTISLESIEVYGKSKVQRAREGAFSVNAIDVRRLAGSTVSLTSLIGRTTGVKVREEGGVGSDFDLSVNGLSGNSVRYFIDGLPLEAKGSGVSLANLPVSIIDHIEIYKGVVPASLSTDALGGAVNIVTKREQKNYLDASYGIGSFHTHKADVSAQLVEKRTGLVVRPTLSASYSKNDYTVRDVEVWDEESRRYVPVDRKRFHDDYFALLAQIEAGVSDKTWADALFFSASYTTTRKELQTGSVQSKVYGMAERQGHAWSLSARYQKRNFLTEGLRLSASLSHTWDYSLTVDTAYRKYDWNGNYILSSRNEINGRSRSMRHYDRPLTVARANLDYTLAPGHSLNLNYLLSRTGNNRYDEADASFVPSDDVLAKHVLALSYEQRLLHERLSNVFFAKGYLNHVNIGQTDLGSITGSDEVQGSATKPYAGYGAASRFAIAPALALKASYEHSVRLPLARELLGNGTTVYANVALKPEQSHNANLGLFGTWRPARGHTLSYEAGGFLRYVDNYIQATVSEKEGLMQYENVPAVHIKGVEGELRYDWRSRLLLRANASYEDARDQRRLKDDGKPSATYRNRVPNRPWLFGSAEAAYDFGNVLLADSRLRLSLSYEWFHWYFLTWEAYGSRESKARIPAQHVFDLALDYSWDEGRYGLSLQCANLLDRTAYDNYKLQKPGRAFFAKFRLFIN